MLIKVCGIKFPEDIPQVNATGVDMIGLNFYKPSKRYINPESLPGHGFSRFNLSGVFVDEDPDWILETAEKFSLSVIQLHGNESADMINKINSHLKVIKAIPVKNKESLLKASEYPEADYLLFDTATREYGGSGIRFDWELLQHYSGPTPFILAGGIGPGDITDLKKIDHPAFAGVDINSGFEVSPGKKDLELIKLFVSKMKNDEY